MVDYLIERGAKIHNALITAVYRNDMDTFKAFLESGKVNLRDRKSVIAFKLAYRLKQKEMTSELLKRGKFKNVLTREKIL